MNLPGAKLLLTPKQREQVKQAVDEWVEDARDYLNEIRSKIYVNGFAYDDADEIWGYLAQAYYVDGIDD